jgi:hypothetical protein
MRVSAVARWMVAVRDMDCSGKHIFKVKATALLYLLRTENYHANNQKVLAPVNCGLRTQGSRCFPSLSLSPSRARISTEKEKEKEKEALDMGSSERRAHVPICSPGSFAVRGAHRFPAGALSRDEAHPLRAEADQACAPASAGDLLRRRLEVPRA